MLKKILLILLAVVLLTAAGVYIYMRSKVRVAPDAPPITTFTGYTENQLSTLTFPLSIDLKDVQDKLNDQLENKPIHVVMPIDDGAGTLEIDIKYYDDIKLEWESPQMTAVVPLDISATIDTKRMGIRIHNEKPITAKVEATMLVQMDLAEGWVIKCDAALKYVTWIENPKLEVGKFQVPLNNIVEKQITEHQDDIEKAIEKKINRALRIHDVVEKVWGDIQKPILVNKKGIPLYLKIRGHGLSAKWQSEATENPTMLVSVEGFYELNTGEYGKSDTTKTPLPEFQKATAQQPGIHAFINARLHYEEINKLIQPKLDSLKLEFAEYKVKIRDLGIYGGDSLIFFKVDLRGDIRGSIYLKGKPKFTGDGKTITIDNFNYDLYTESELASTAEDWMHDLLLAKANDFLTFEMDSLLEKLPDAMMNGIEKSKIGNKIDLAIDSLNVKPISIRSATDHLALQIQVDGDATLRLEKEVLKKKKKVVVPMR